MVEIDTVNGFLNEAIVITQLNSPNNHNIHHEIKQCEIFHKNNLHCQGFFYGDSLEGKDFIWVLIPLQA